MTRIAIPLAAGRLSLHFGHCQEFALFDVDPETKEIAGKETALAPGRVPGLLRRWLHGQGAHIIIASGIGQRAQQLFTQDDVTDVVGAVCEFPEQIISAHIGGTLEGGENICDD